MSDGAVERPAGHALASALRQAGENLDALMTLDLRGWGVGRRLYARARADAGAPLSLTAARALEARAGRHGVWLICTGFCTPPWGCGETDGVIGAVVLARSVDRAGAGTPVLVCEPELVEPVRRLLRRAGLNLASTAEEAVERPGGALVAAFPKDPASAEQAAEALLARLRPVGVISVERPGANAQGVYHTGRGLDVTEYAAKVDILFRLARSRGVLTIAIGDLGNELGMGGLADVVRAAPYGRCRCGCPGGTAAAEPADHVIVASVSDWGAYALAAAWGALRGRDDILHSPELQSRLMWDAGDAGLLDGPSVRPVPAIDGVGEDFHRHLVALMHRTASEPLAFARSHPELFPPRPGEEAHAG